MNNLHNKQSIYPKPSTGNLQQKILAWYDKNARKLPWRAEKNQKPNPYHVWLSEMMLQQTTVKTVEKYFINFLEKWSTINDMARADGDDIMKAWAGLGYYARARNLHACAQKIMKEHGGVMPEDIDQLLNLPGIGPYSSKAIASIAFGQNVMPVDGNIERVISRIYALSSQHGDVKKNIQDLAQKLQCPQNSPHLTQAMMDLGGMVCTARKAHCDQCPVTSQCHAYQYFQPLDFPGKKKKLPPKKQYAHLFFIWDEKNQSLIIEQRKKNGLLGGMFQCPTSQWTHEDLDLESVKEQAPDPQMSLISIKNPVQHTFTHIKLTLHIALAFYQGENLKHQKWCAAEKLYQYPWSTLMKKVFERMEKHLKVQMKMKN